VILWQGKKEQKSKSQVIKNHEVKKLADIAYKFFENFVPTSKYMFFLDAPPEVLLKAYQNGLFPMGTGESGEIEWYSADPRGVLDPKEFKIYEGSFHAQHMFKSSYADELTQLIIDFITN